MWKLQALPNLAYQERRTKCQTPPKLFWMQPGAAGIIIKAGVSPSHPPPAQHGPHGRAPEKTWHKNIFAVTQSRALQAEHIRAAFALTLISLFSYYSKAFLGNSQEAFVVRFAASPHLKGLTDSPCTVGLFMPCTDRLPQETRQPKS